MSTPDNHLAASPDRSMGGARCRRADFGHGNPGIALGIIASPIAKSGIAGEGNIDCAGTPPDDRLLASPNHGVLDAACWSAGAADCSPAIGCWIIEGAAIGQDKGLVVIRIKAGSPTPNQHLSASPNRCMIGSWNRRFVITDWGPGISAGIIAGAISSCDKAVVADVDVERTAPNDHRLAGPDCAMVAARSWGIGHTDWGPTISSGIVDCSAPQAMEVGIDSAPDNHLLAGPDGAIKDAGGWGIDGGDSAPGIGGREVCAAILLQAKHAQSTPNDHRLAGPDRSMLAAIRWRVT